MMKALFDIRRFRLYAWVGLAIIAMCTLHEMISHKSFGRALLNCTWLSVYLTAIDYILFEAIVPTLRWRRFYWGVLYGILYLFLFSEGFYWWARLGWLLHLNTDYIGPAGARHDSNEEMAFSFTAALLFGIVSHIYHHVRLRQTAQQLKIEKQSAELNYLKSQTNPHFLFNTLNNIYSLARDKSDLAPESILRLSKILRYMLYETNGPFIAIEQELKIISDYISLEKLRYDESLRVNFDYDVEDLKQSLPPLLLIPLVENAFKHGTSETRHRPFIDIHLSVSRRQLLFTIRNSTEDQVADGTGRHHIGLSNLRRQLELLYSDYQVSFEQRTAEFVATLKINLASHV